MRDLHWYNWNNARPLVGEYWWRAPTAVYGEVEMRPIWTEQVHMCGMGYNPFSQPWPGFSRWDGYNRTVPTDLQWAEMTAEELTPKNRHFKQRAFIPMALKACPFCRGEVELFSDEYGNGARFYSDVYHPTQFWIRCQCGVSTDKKTSAKKVIDTWSRRD